MMIFAKIVWEKRMFEFGLDQIIDRYGYLNRGIDTNEWQKGMKNKIKL